MSSQAVEQVAEQVSRVPVPRFLQDIGVAILEDKTLGARIVAIPSAVREKCNVIDPVTSLVQADPNWSPRISVCELNPSKDGPHFYSQAGGKLAPTKQALETLAKAAGILYTRTARIARGELADGEIGYRATVGIRRSDGTVEEILREKVWVEEAERAEVEEAVTAARAYNNGQRTNNPKWVPDSDEWKAEVHKRWLREMRDRYAKTESKAVLRAIRAALQIPHTFTPADAAKPFLVVGFNFTPDYDDEEVKRMLVAAGLNAQAAIYGGGTQTTPINLATGELPPAGNEPEEEGGRPAVSPDPQQAGEATSPPASSVPEDDDPEPVAAGDSSGEDGGDAVIPGGAYEGQTLAQVAALGPDGEEYLAWMARNAGRSSVGPVAHAALQKFRPALFDPKGA